MQLVPSNTFEMYSLLEVAVGGHSPTGTSADRNLIGSGSRRSRWWPMQRLASRRVKCRLPLLALWTFVMMCILYMCLSGSNDNLESSGIEDSRPTANSFHDQDQLIQHGGSKLHYDKQQQATELVVGSQENYSLRSSLQPEKVIQQTTRRIEPKSKHRANSARIHETTTSGGSRGQYARLSKVFILIIEDESYKFKYNYRKNVKFGSTQQVDIDDRLVVGPHIRLLIDILVSHKIEYSIDTTKSGLPTRLLTDQDVHTNGSGRKQYSVIIIDDFIKYTKLSRWNRDQLDRYCRSNQIGVITYLNSESLMSGATTSTPPGSTSSHSGESYTSNEFPLKFKLHDQRKDCGAKQNNINATTRGCLVDLQLNDRSPILRVLKRKKDFVLAGQLEENLNGSPWVSLASNHITYEPLTWAAHSGGGSDATSEGSDEDNDSHLRPRRRARPETPMPVTARDSKLASQSTRDFTSPFSSTNTQIRDQVDRFVYAKLRATPNTLTGSGVQTWKGNINRTSIVVDKTTASSTFFNLDFRHGDGGDIEVSEENSKGSELLVELQSEASDFRVGDEIDAEKSASQADVVSEESSATTSNRETLSIFDRGLYDGIRRVIFGGANHIWLNRILLLDSIEHLSSGLILTPLDRYIQIDIDDIFVGELGKRMNKSDVDSLLEVQEKFSRLIDGGFKFNLGFSGKYFKHGNEEENLGDEYLVEKASNFQWFCHFWSHAKAHLINSSYRITLELEKNLNFANEKKLPLIGHEGKLGYLREYLATNGSSRLPPTYAVAPHHSGVYPIHEQLYEAWTKTLNVQVTSTEEYPHLRPANGRRGFVHKTIKVLPRQTCGLYTHTIWRHKYPGGVKKLHSSIRGGELFETILHNQVNIYMTHMTNYANDRLAPYTFTELINFVQNYTILNLKSASSLPDESLVSYDSNPESKLNLNKNNGKQPTMGPAKLADYYFNLHPNEREPLWTNPCCDKRHLDIWTNWKLDTYCPLAPKLLIVGPQKTGTTALYSFLKLNPQFKSLPNDKQPPDFEEIQFFNDKYYQLGSDWYFRRFLPNDSDLASRASSARLTLDGSIERPEGTSASTQIADSNNTASAFGAAYSEGDYGAVADHHQQQQERLLHIYFDKSATYFDDPKVPRRAHELLPEAKIIIILIDPADRAYSWYQHIKAHNDSIATKLTFGQVLTWRDPAASALDTPNELEFSRKVKVLRSRCLQPGFYAQHLMAWLNYYPSRQVIIVDGEWFRWNPAAVMNKLQLLLRVESPLDYNHLLVFDKLKGFYCQLEKSAANNNNYNNSDDNGYAHGKVKKCLGSGKGRKYEPMGEEARLYLNRYFWQSNKQLAHILSEIGQPLPKWLDRMMAINSSPSSSLTTLKTKRRRRSREKRRN